MIAYCSCIRCGDDCSTCRLNFVCKICDHWCTFNSSYLSFLMLFETKFCQSICRSFFGVCVTFFLCGQKKSWELNCSYGCTGCTLLLRVHRGASGTHCVSVVTAHTCEDTRSHTYTVDFQEDGEKKTWKPNPPSGHNNSPVSYHSKSQDYVRIIFSSPYHHFSPCCDYHDVGELKATAALHLSTFSAPIWRQSNRKGSLVCELSQKEKRQQDGQSPCKWMKQWLPNRPLYATEERKRKNWLPFHQLSYLNIWELCICTFSPASMPIKVMLLCLTWTAVRI